MKIIFYTYPYFFDVAIPFLEKLSDYVKIDMFLELSPYNWMSGMFDLGELELPVGICDGKVILKKYFPEEITRVLDKLKSLNLVVYKNKKSISIGSFRTSLKVAKYIQELKPDIVHFDGISLKASYGIKYLSKIPLVCNIHDPFAHSGEENWRKTLAQILSYSHIKNFILFNKYYADEFSKKYKINRDKIFVSKLGTHELFYQNYKNGTTCEDGSILFIGKLSKYKGLEIFLESIKIISNNSKGYSFVVAGKPYPGYKIPSIPTLNNSNKLKIIDKYLTNQELAELIQKSTMIVCPYLDATQSGVVLTAYAFDKPVIATKVGGLPEYVWDYQTGLIVPPRDANALAEAIVKLKENPKLIESFKLNITEKKSSVLNWNMIANNTIELYKKVMN